MGCARMPGVPAQLRSEFYDGIGDPLFAEWLRVTRKDKPMPSLPAGGFICGDGVEPCSGCGIVADYLCDAPMGEGKTCDLPLCEQCRRPFGEFDLCPFHHRERAERLLP